MDIISTVAAIVGIAQNLFEIKDKIKSKEQKKEISEWIHDTGNLLAGVVEDIRNGIYPYSKCSQLNHILNNLSDCIADLLKKDQYDQIKSMIAEAYKVEQMFVELNNMNHEEKEKNLNKVEESVGIFYSLANFIKLE